MQIRAIRLDVDWARTGPSIEQISEAVSSAAGVSAGNVTITEIDVETIGSDIAVEGEDISLSEVIAAIEQAGAVVRSIDQIIFGDRHVPYAPRVR
jgi:uncharacterized protein